MKTFLLILFTAGISLSLSLKEAEDLVLKNYSRIKEKRLELKEQEKKVKETLGSLLPSLGLELSYNFAKEQSFSFSLPPLPAREFTFVRGNYYSLSARLTQRIFSRIQLDKVSLERKKKKLKELELEREVQEVLLEVRRAYLKALSAKATLSIYRKYEERVRRHLENVMSLYEKGYVAYKDVLETRVKLFEIKAEVRTAEGNYRKALNYLSYLVGERIEDVEDVDLETLMKAFERIKEDPEGFLRGSVYLRYARALTGIAEEGVKLAKATFYPEIVLSAAYQRTDESDIFPRDRYLVSLSLRWNVFSGLSRLRMLERSRIRLKRALIASTDTEEKLKVTLKNLIEDVETLRSREALAKERLKDAEEHLRIAREKYTAGYGTNSEVLDAESYLTDAQNSLRIVRYMIAEKIFEILEVTGYEE